MSPLKHFKNLGVHTVFTDIDDTLTTGGRLPAQSYAALWKLCDHGINVVPVTGRPAGWCELIARLWPVRGVIGENGAFYFCHRQNKMVRYYEIDRVTASRNEQKLERIREEILTEIPEAAVASDQFARLFDLAIDICEDVPPVSQDKVQRIVEIFKNHGAQAKVSSIHVNGWFGHYDKLSMVKNFCRQELNFELTSDSPHAAFIGDSPNDEPMFAYFKNSFAVANIRHYEEQLTSPPTYVTEKAQASGFAEFVDHLLNC